MGKPVQVDTLIKVKEESTDSTLSYDLSSDAHHISKFINVDHYEEPGGYGFVDAMHAIMKENIEEHRRTIAAREKIGKSVTKTFHGRKSKGEVVDYDAKKKWFKVVYENGKSEYVDRDEADRIVVCTDPLEVSHDYEPRVKEEKIELVPVPVPVPVPVHVLRNRAQTSAKKRFPRREVAKEEPKTKKAKPRGRKRGRPAAKPSTGLYVPLYTQKMKDAYYWY